MLLPLGHVADATALPTGSLEAEWATGDPQVFYAWLQHWHKCHTACQEAESSGQQASQPPASCHARDAAYRLALLDITGPSDMPYHMEVAGVDRSLAIASRQPEMIGF